MEGLRSWLAKQRVPGLEPGSRHFNFRDMVSPVSKKSRFDRSIVKAMLNPQNNSIQRKTIFNTCMPIYKNYKVCTK